MLILDQLVKHLGRNTVTVMLFHKVPLKLDPLVPRDPDLLRFEQMLDFVMAHFNIVPLSEVAMGLDSGRLPHNAACITFDDGYAGWLTGVVPALQRRNAHATFFLTTGQLSGTPMWHERIIQAVAKAPFGGLHMPGFDVPVLSNAVLADKQAAVVWLQNHLKYQTLSQRNAMLESLERSCGVGIASLPLMPAADIKQLSNLGFGIGTHTVNHPILTHTTQAEAVYEIGEAREQLEGIIGGRVDSFAYPNGRPGADFQSKHIAMVRSAGYRYAVTTQHGVIRQGCSVYQMPRFTPWGPDWFRMLAQLLRNQIGSNKRLSEP
jgi:peptidoglycan/xylan/chitin deacetylase (PgdA/CDA1 family)